MPVQPQQPVAIPIAKPAEPLPKVVWPALGAGDYLLPQAQPQWLVGPVVSPSAPLLPPAQPQGLAGPVVGPSARLLPALSWPAGSSEFDIPQGDIKVEGPVNDCPIRPLSGLC